MTAGIRKIRFATLASALALASSSAFAQTTAAPSDGQRSGNETQLDDIVVTAQKRAQSLNDVGISVNAFTGAQLADKGISDPSDLIKIVPGFTYTRSQFDFPTYTLRGVGYYESSLAASPTVSVYVDEAPLPFPAMTRGAILDLERLEVLKGPQGILFGQNSTGGAINYIAAKPTKEWHAGLSGSYGRFDRFEGEGFVSGPLADNLQARLAIKTEQGGAYQYSATRPGDKLGTQRFFTGRFLLAYQPSSTFRLNLNVNGWSDKSDTQAAQVAEVTPVNPALPVDPRVSTSAITNFNARIAEWNSGLALRRDNQFYQASLRAEWDVASNATLTSLTSYQDYHQYAFQDADGTTARNLHLIPRGRIKSFTQELRLSGKAFDGKLNYVIGGNYEDSRIRDNQQVFLGESTGAFVGPFQFDTFYNDARNKITNYAAFGNAEYNLTRQLSIQAGVRYTNSKTEYNSCTIDSGAGDLSTIFAFLQSAVYSVPVTARAGQCVTLLSNFSTGRYSGTLHQDNVSWRVGVNFKPGGGNGALLYANVSQGYKAGSFPTLSASNAAQLLPVTQERLVAYEAGFKVPLADHRLQLNGAVFYYDYTNKQLRGRVLDPVFGELERLVNIPKSRIAGAELQLLARPVTGLTLSANGSYLSSRILRNPDGTNFTNFAQRGASVPFTGNSFPYTPNWQLSGDVDYKFPVTERLQGFVGTAVTYQSRSKAGLENSDTRRPANTGAAAGAAFNDPALSLPAYTLLDLRAGIEAPDAHWKVSIYGKNVTNTYYVVNTLKVQDTLTRYSGRPAEYGVSFAVRF